jgi:flagellar biosynthesis chaperone FliJ
MAEVKLSIEEYHNVVKNLNTLIKKLYETTKKCKDYKRQRDELINDMAETKRKAKAFDFISNFYTTEIEQAIKNKELNQCLFLLEQILDDLERGSDE